MPALVRDKAVGRTLSERVLEAWRRIFGMAAWQGLCLLTVGWVLGTGLAVGLARLLEKPLFGVAGLDITTFILGSAGLYLVGLVACLVPIWRAACLQAIIRHRPKTSRQAR